MADPSQSPKLIKGILKIQLTTNPVLQIQTEIGWLHLFRGFVGDEWGHSAAMICSALHPSEKVPTLFSTRLRYVLLG